MEDCESEYYSTSIIGQFDRDPVNYPKYNPWHGIFIYLPSGLNTHYVHSPRLQGVEYVCYFASVVSLWFGFSIITISEALVKAYELYQEHNINKKINAKTKEVENSGKENHALEIEEKDIETCEKDVLTKECVSLKLFYDKLKTDFEEKFAQLNHKINQLDKTNTQNL